MENENQELFEKKSIIRVPVFPKFYVTNIAGGATDQDFRYELLNEKSYDSENEKWNYYSDGLLILSPVGAKKLWNKLSADINLYEREHGIISMVIENELTY
ncbi:hypothetical protein MsAg5_03560 [Methanosarcinaceae archaeon Ag5]|uniref:Uncharacterized protein n=1 Tax=Methanolapillus africanus TaxID=3028297 RepID=A0AAE4SD91_9EURY|nr:hypothetical protein [Methanosarcinaceae archaeon Ag5]